MFRPLPQRSIGPHEHEHEYEHEHLHFTLTGSMAFGHSLQARRDIKIFILACADRRIWRVRGYYGSSLGPGHREGRQRLHYFPKKLCGQGNMEGQAASRIT